MHSPTIISPISVSPFQRAYLTAPGRDHRRDANVTSAVAAQDDQHDHPKPVETGLPNTFEERIDGLVTPSDTGPKRAGLSPASRESSVNGAIKIVAENHDRSISVPHSEHTPDSLPVRS